MSNKKKNWKKKKEEKKTYKWTILNRLNGKIWARNIKKQFAQIKSKKMKNFVFNKNQTETTEKRGKKKRLGMETKNC